MRHTVTVNGFHECIVSTVLMVDCCFFAGMNSAVRAVVRMGLYVGCKVFLIQEVRKEHPQ